MTIPNRRQILKAAVLTPAIFLLQDALVFAAARRTQVRPGLLMRAKAALDAQGEWIAHRDIIAIADFALPSRDPRFHVINLESGQTNTFLLAHGRGSDPSHSGYLQRFSNEPGSFATAQGAYVTGDIYMGKHGKSRHLTGLEPTNDHANQRAIVIHSASYVSEVLAQERGKLGRSEGCFTVAKCDQDEVLQSLGPGRLLFAGKI